MAAINRYSDKTLVTDPSGFQIPLFKAKQADARIDADVFRATKGVNVLAHDANGDGSHDNHEAFQAAINAAKATGGSRIIKIPAGVYRFEWRLSRGALDITGGDLTFVGEGVGRTVILMENNLAYASNTAGDHCLFYHPAADPPVAYNGGVEFRGIEFRGKWGTTGFTPTVTPDISTPHGTVMILQAFDFVKFSDCRFKNIVDFAMNLELIKHVEVRACEFDTVCRDSVHVRNSRRVLVDGNYFVHSDDDTLAIGGQSYREAHTETGEVAIITNNIFEDTGGPSISAARQITYANNIHVRCKGGVTIAKIDPSYSPLNPNKFGISVTGNKWFDLTNRAWSPETDYRTALTLSGNTMLASSGVIPGTVDRTTGLYKDWYQFRDGNDPVGAAHWLQVSGNIIARTLPAVAKYSDWGFGQKFDPRGFVDPAVTEAGLRTDAGITFVHAWRNVDMHDNQIATCKIGIILNLDDATDLPYQFDNVKIHHNHFWDIVSTATGRGSGIATTGATPDAIVRIDVEDNVFDMDPKYLSIRRVALGGGRNSTWSAAVTGEEHCALFTDLATGVRFVRNVIANCQFPIIDFSSNDANYYADNVLIVDFVTAVTGRGVGNWTEARGYRYFQVNLDVTSGDFGKPREQMVDFAASIPTSGIYKRGHFVRSTAPVATTRILGWARITTGSAHVLDTDWIEVDGFQGPASATDNAIVRWDGTTGRIVQNAVATLSDVAVLDLNHATAEIQIAGTKVVDARITGWTVPTGSVLRTAFDADWTQSISAVVAQSEAQAIVTQIVALQKRLAAVETDLIAHGLIGT